MVAFLNGLVSTLLVGAVYAVLATQFPLAATEKDGPQPLGSRSFFLRMFSERGRQLIAAVVAMGATHMFLTFLGRVFEDSWKSEVNVLVSAVLWAISAFMLVVCLALDFYGPEGCGIQEKSQIVTMSAAMVVGGLVMTVVSVAYPSEPIFSNQALVLPDWVSKPWLFGLVTAAVATQATAAIRAGQWCRLESTIAALLNLILGSGCFLGVVPGVDDQSGVLVIFACAFNSVLCTQMHTSGTLWEMAPDSELPSRTKNQEPQWALAVTILLQAILVVFGWFEAGLGSIAICFVTFLFAHLAIMAKDTFPDTTEMQLYTKHGFVVLVTGIALLGMMVSLVRWGSEVLVGWVLITEGIWASNQFAVFQ